MPPSASSQTGQSPAAPASAPSWFAFAAGHARSIHKLIRQGADNPSDQDWASSTSRRKTRRPAWE
jgi:hypothetical protein